jgi:hypothetical protein
MFMFIFVWLLQAFTRKPRTATMVREQHSMSPMRLKHQHQVHELIIAQPLALPKSEPV